MDTDKVAAIIAAASIFTTRVTDTVTRSISSRSLPWSRFSVRRNGEQFTVEPVEASVYYYKARSGDGPWDTHVTAHVLARRVGKNATPVGEYLSASFTAANLDVWPEWLRMWAELHHPERGGVDQDPEGSYL